MASLFVLFQVHKLCFNSLEETEQCLAINGGTLKPVVFLLGTRNLTLILVVTGYESSSISSSEIFRIISELI